MFAVGAQPAVEVESLLHGLRVVQRLDVRHLLPIVASPALRQHQQVGGTAVLGVVGLEVVVHIVDISPHVAAEQHPLLDVAVRAVLHCGGIHGGER